MWLNWTRKLLNTPGLQSGEIEIETILYFLSCTQLSPEGRCPGLYLRGIVTKHALLFWPHDYFILKYLWPSHHEPPYCLVILMGLIPFLWSFTEKKKKEIKANTFTIGRKSAAQSYKLWLLSRPTTPQPVYLISISEWGETNRNHILCHSSLTSPHILSFLGYFPSCSPVAPSFSCQIHRYIGMAMGGEALFKRN